MIFCWNSIFCGICVVSTMLIEYLFCQAFVAKNRCKCFEFHHYIIVLKINWIILEIRFNCKQVIEHSIQSIAHCSISHFLHKSPLFLSPLTPISWNRLLFYIHWNVYLYVSISWLFHQNDVNNFLKITLNFFLFILNL